MELIRRFRVAIIAATLLITLFFGYFMTKITNDASTNAIIPEEHKDIQYYYNTEKLFGEMEMVVISITDRETIYSKKALTAINELSNMLKELEEIDEDDVVSLTEIDNMEGEYGELLIEPLIDDVDSLDDEAIALLKERVEANPLFDERLVTNEGKTTIAAAGVPGYLADSSELQIAFTNKLYKGIDEIGSRYDGLEFNLSGGTIAEARTSEYMDRDMATLVPFAILLIVVLLLLIMRKFFGMLIPLLVSITAIVWTFGLKGLVGSTLSITETAIPVMLIAIGCADGVHIMTEFYQLRAKGLAAKEALKETMRILAAPVIMTSITTSLGFISLLTAPGVSVRKMGLYLGFGVIVAMLFSLLVIPALLSFFKKETKKEKARKQTPLASSIDKLYKGWGKLVYKGRFLILGTSLLVLTLSIAGVMKIRVESDMIKSFHKNDPFRVATDRIRQDAGGVNELFIIIEADEENALKEPAIQQAMWDLQKYVEAFEIVSYSYSLADYVRFMNYLINDSDDGYMRIPAETEKVVFENYEMVDGEEVIVEEERMVEGRRQIANLLLLYDMGGGETLDELVNSNYTKANIRVRLKDTDNDKINELIAALDNYRAKNFPLQIKVNYTNYYIYVIISQLIVKSQIVSLITSLVAILILLSIIFRSLLNGFIVLLPTTIAVFFNFAIMWLFDIPLDIGTSIVASIGLGVGIDYSIHYFSRFQYLYRECGNYKEAIIGAIEGNARGILANAVAVGAGFMVLTFSNFQVIFNMGWIIGLSMFTTALNALIILPAVTAIVKPKVKLKEVTKKDIDITKTSPALNPEQ